jgi:hypothetical protein
VTYATLHAELQRLNAEVKAQRDKFDNALASGLTGAPLVRIDQKLVRLERERDDLYDRIQERFA